ncbi:MAG: PepSY domain-containing protein [Alkalilacustris sp.]
MAKTALTWLHRWLTLLLLPPLLFLIVTGGILAVQPVVQDVTSGPALQRPVPVPEAVALLARVDGDNRVRALRFEEPGLAVMEFARAGERRVRVFDMAGGRDLGERQEGAAFFHTVSDLHKHFVWGLQVLIEVATYGMVLVLLAGPFLGWPRLRNTAPGWHMGLGWAFGPLAGLVAVTGAMMLLGIGTPDFPAVDRSAGRYPLPQALEAAARAQGLSHVETVRTAHQAAVIVTGRAGETPVTLVAMRGGVTPIAAHPGLVERLHTGTWGGAWSGALYLAAMLALLGLTGTGLWSWGRRLRAGRVRMGDAGADILVAWGSQTGTAAGLGAATVAALRQGGAKVAGASLGAVAPAELRRFREVLLIVSTAGDGAVPDPARGFHAALPGADLTGVRFALLALGDSSYRNFCAGGLAVRDALRAAGAQEVQPVEKVDRDPAAPWRDWLQAAAARLAITPGAVTAPEGDRPVVLSLRRRVQLNDPTDPDTREVHALTLESPQAMGWQPGDLLLVSPAEGEPERPYSIGASPLEGDRTLMLTVSLVVHDGGTDGGAMDGGGTDGGGTDGGPRFGRASQLLCRSLPEGGKLEARLRRHPSFHLPEDPDRPVIMVATGCGIAPFPGFLAHKAAGGHRGPMWLFFGTQKRAGDYFHGARLEAWQASGVLDRFDPAFSLDAGGGGFVQDRLIARGAELLDWLMRRDAVLYACGRRATVGDGTRHALHQILCTHGGLPPAAARDRLHAWEATGTVRFDLTD